MQIALKKIMRRIEWDNFYESLDNCRKKLKDSFVQFYLRRKEREEDINRMNVKDQNSSYTNL